MGLNLQGTSTPSKLGMSFSKVALKSLRTPWDWPNSTTICQTFFLWGPMSNGKIGGETIWSRGIFQGHLLHFPFHILNLYWFEKNIIMFLRDHHLEVLSYFWNFLSSIHSVLHHDMFEVVNQILFYPLYGFILPSINIPQFVDLWSIHVLNYQVIE